MHDDMDGSLAGSGRPLAMQEGWGGHAAPLPDVIRSAQRSGARKNQERAEMKKAHEPKFVGFFKYLAGSAGFEPATNGLKVRKAAGIG